MIKEMVVKKLIASVFFCLLFALAVTAVNAQNVLDDVEEETRSDMALSGEQAPNLVSETIKAVSRSKKIFILTNENKSFSKGDFISLLLANKLICRALVAKTTEEKLSGIKIVKIYNLALWKQLAIGKEVLILKGDDSYYSNKEKSPIKEPVKDAVKEKKEAPKVQTPDDLFNATSNAEIEDDLSINENINRLIKTDNLISLNVGLIKAQDVDGASKMFTQLNGSWAYQLSDNIWAEAGVGSNTIRDYPSTGLDTRLINLTVKAKYTFSAPMYSYFQPYVGYQTILASAPGAGSDPGDGSISTAQLKNETQLVNDLKKRTVIFGVTFLKRIVPGWFIKADLGTDILNGGLCLEF